MAAVELKTSHSEFCELHEVAAVERGKYKKVPRDLLMKLLMDHSAMVAALGNQTKEPK
jgi:hypothetical protein